MRCLIKKWTGILHIGKISNFLIALFTTSILIFLFFEKIAMPIYIRKGNSIRLINVRGKILDRGINELKISGFGSTAANVPSMVSKSSQLISDFSNILCIYIGVWEMKIHLCVKIIYLIVTCYNNLSSFTYCIHKLKPVIN